MEHTRLLATQIALETLNKKKEKALKRLAEIEEQIETVKSED